MPAQLTLELDPQLLRQAERYAEKLGKPLSQLISEYLARLLSQNDRQEHVIPPMTHSLRGILRGVQIDEQDYAMYLEKKYV